MVTVDGVTYRIERVDRGRYVAVSLIDDSLVGTFRASIPITIESDARDRVLLERVGRAAIQSGRTSTVFNETPVPPPMVEPLSGELEEEPPPLTPLRRAPA